MDRSLIIYSVVFVWLGVVSFFAVKIYRTFRKLTKGVLQKDLVAVLEEVLKRVGRQENISLDLSRQIEFLKNDGLKHIQKVGIIRYNPFSDTGGNQSFVLSLLDGEGNGFVITSLHSREATRVFAKPVKHGKESGYEFSKEEIQAVLAAQEIQKSKK